MKELAVKIKTFIRDDYSPVTYIPVFIYVTLMLIANFCFNFENTYLDRFTGTLKGFVFFYLYYSVAYIPVAVYVLLINNKVSVLKNKSFWFSVLFIIAILAASAFFSFYDKISGLFENISDRYLIKKILINSRNFLVIIFPLIFFWFIFNPYKSGFLWIKIRNYSFRSYLIIILLMLPVVAAASFFKDFQAVYPTYKYWAFTEGAFGMNKFANVIIYEIFYCLDFVTIEMLFRGALVAGMINIMGKDCILPMVSIYCFLHFGKPAGEAFSSIFGGYFLGIIAYSTKSVTGGTVVHMGVALMMEVFANLQYIFK